MKYATDVLMKQEYDHRKAAVETEDLINQHYRSVAEFKGEDNSEKYRIKTYKKEGIEKRGKSLQNKFQLINQKLNESISKTVASFVVTSFVSDSYCKREHLENQMQALHSKTIQGGAGPPKELVDRLKQESLPYVQLDTFMKRPPQTTNLTGDSYMFLYGNER